MHRKRPTTIAVNNVMLPVGVENVQSVSTKDVHSVVFAVTVMRVAIQLIQTKRMVNAYAKIRTGARNYTS